MILMPTEKAEKYQPETSQKWNNQMKYVKHLAVAALLAASALPARAENITISVSATPSTFADMFKKVTSAFEQQNPDIKVDLLLGAREQDAQLQDTLRGAITGNLPDVSFQGFNHLATLLDRGLPVKLDDFIAKEPDWQTNGYAGGVTTTGTFVDGVYALGAGTSVPIIYYNADLVEKAGGNLKALPGTWDSVLELAKKIAALGQDIQGGIFQYQSSGNWTFQALINAQGGTMMTADRKKISFDGPEGLEALKIIRRFGETGQSKIDMSTDQARQLFLGGNVGILVDSSSSLANFEKQIGDRFRLRTTALPLGENGKLPAAGIASVMFAKEPARQAAAWRFMKFISGPEGQTILGQSTGYTPANTLVAQDARYLLSYYAERANAGAANSVVNKLGPWFSFPGENSVKITDVIKSHLQDVVLLRKNPTDALVTMKSDVEKLLRQ